MPKGGVVPWDPVAAAGLTHIEKFSYRHCQVSIKDKGISQFTENTASKDIMLTDFDKDWFLAELLAKINRATSQP